MHNKTPAAKRRGRQLAAAALAVGAALAASAALAAGAETAPPLQQPAPVTAVWPYGEAVAARFPAPLQRYDTPGLREGREHYTSDEELATLLRELAAREGGPRLVHAGTSAQGRAIEALLFGPGDGSRPLVMLVGQQHGDEPAPAEALLVLAQQLAGGQPPGVLEAVDVLLLPRANPDGALQGTRRGVHGLDINRDHLLLRTPEAAALAALARRWQPMVFVDAHEYLANGRQRQRFGMLPRHDLLLQYATTANLPAPLLRASERWFRRPLLQALAREDLSTDWYHTGATAPGDLRLSMGGVQADIARNVQGLGHTVSLLLESRGVGIGRLHLQRRVHSHVVAMRSILVSAAARADELSALRTELQAQTAALACLGEVVVLAAQTLQRRELLMLDAQTGADRLLEVPWNSSLELRTVQSRRRPCGYWLDEGALAAVQRLQALGLQVQRLGEDTELALEDWHDLLPWQQPPEAARGPAGEAPPRLVQVRLAAERRRVAAGGWWLSLAQPRAHLAVAALEPDTPASFYANHLLPALGSAARVVEMPGR